MRRREPLKVFLALACLKFLVASSALGETYSDWVPIRDFTRRFEVAGVSVLPPRGLGWYMKQSQSERKEVILFGKFSEDLQKSGQDVFAAVESVALERNSPYSHASVPLLEAKARRFVESSAEPGLIKLREFTGAATTIDRGTCFRYKALTEEYEDPSGSRFVGRMTGLECFHPDVPRLISVSVGQRVRAGGEPVRIDREVEGFLEFVQFKALSRG